MKRNVLKTISIALLVFLMVFTFATPVFAAGGALTGAAEQAAQQTQKPVQTSGYVSENGDYNNITFTAKEDSGAADSVTRIIGAIIRIVQIVGIGVAIIMLIVLAIKYISAAPNDKAEIKKHLVVYVVGAILLFSAAGVLEIIRNFALNNIQPKTADTNAANARK